MTSILVHFEESILGVYDNEPSIDRYVYQNHPTNCYDFQLNKHNISWEEYMKEDV